MPEAVSDGIQVNRITIRLIKGDITDLEEIDAFVYYAQSDLALGSGYGTAISVRGGPTVQKELEALAPVATGEAVVTDGGKLKASHIIHAVGPKFQEEDTEGKLRTTMLNALARANENGIRRLAFPAMGAGYYGVAPELSAKVMFEVIRKHADGETSLEEIVICVLDSRQFKAFLGPLAALA